MDLDRDDLKKALKGQKIGRLTKKEVQELRKEIDKKLEPIELTYGVKFQLGRIRFDDVSFRCKLEASLVNPANGSSADEIHFRRFCRAYGLSPSHFNKEVTFPDYSKFSGRKGRITGINTRAKTYPIIITLEDGTKTKNAISHARRVLGL